MSTVAGRFVRNAVDQALGVPTVERVNDSTCFARTLGVADPLNEERNIAAL